MNWINLSPKVELGQVWTPDDVAIKMVRALFSVAPKAKRILDPACGPATFSRAINSLGIKKIHLDCYDIDNRMAEETGSYNRHLGFEGNTYHSDYLGKTDLKENYDAIIMNPPYIRHEDIGKQKNSYHAYIEKEIRGEIDGRSNLFALFLLKGIIDLKYDGVLCAIVYDAIRQSRYGQTLLNIVNQNCEILSEERILAPFDGVLVDAVIYVLKRRKKILSSTKTDAINLTEGCTRVCELLDVKRGTSFPQRDIFFAKPEEPYYDFAEPIFVKQGSLKGLILEPDHRAYMLNSKNEESIEVSDWLLQKATTANNKIKKISLRPVKGDIAFNYYIRNAPRHLWNPSKFAVSDNFYVSNVRGEFPTMAAWLLLNSGFFLSGLLSAARSQGNGLLKLQLYEYKDAIVPDWRSLTETQVRKCCRIAKSLLKKNAPYEVVREYADKIAGEVW